MKTNEMVINIDDWGDVVPVNWQKKSRLLHTHSSNSVDEKQKG